MLGVWMAPVSAAVPVAAQKVLAAVLNAIAETGGYYYRYRYYRHYGEDGEVVRKRASSDRRRSREREAGQA